jgi:hypothetical protein
MLRAVEDAQLEGAVTTPTEALDWLRARFPLVTEKGVSYE